MTLKSYLRMLLAAVTLLFVTSGCNDDDNKVGPPPSYTFSVAVSDVTETEATVTVTPSNDQATYYYAAVKKADFDAFESDAAYAQNILATLQAAADRKVLSLKEYLETALSKGSAPQKVTDLTAGTDYYAVALGMLTDGRFTSDLVKEAFKTGDAPVAPPVISKAGGYFFGTSFGAFDNFSLWMSEDGVTEDMTVFTGEGTYLIFDLNVTVTGKPTLPAGTFSVASGDEAEENTIAPGADYAGGMMTGSAIVQIKADGTKDYFYIDGGSLKIEVSGSSYVITANVTSDGKEFTFKYEGAVSIFDTTGGGGLELSIDVTNITATTAKVSVTSSDTTSPYYFDLLDEEDYQSYGGTPAGIADFIGELLAYYQAQNPTMTLPQILAQIVSTGNDSYDFDKLTPAAKYYTFAIGLDATTGAATTTAVVEEFTTEAASGGDGPELTLSMRAGDKDGNNKTTTVYVVAQSSAATSAIYWLSTTSTVENKLAAGETYESIVAGGNAFSAEWMTGLNSTGIGLNYNKCQPGESWTMILKVSDADGNSTIKHVAATTETGQGGETGDGPNLTITAIPGKEGAETQTYITAMFKVTGEPAAVSGSYILAEKALVDQLVAEKGLTYEQITEAAGSEFTADNLTKLNANGIGWYFKELTPGTEHIVMSKVTDAAGNSTFKYILASTDPAGEPSDTYKAWLGTWTVTSASSQISKAPVSFDVVFTQKIANVSYAITGWGIDALRDDAELMPTATFDSATGGMALQNDQHLANNGGQTPGKINFVSNVAYQGSYAWVSGTGFNGLSGSMGADKQTATVACGVANIQGIGELPVNGMEVILWDNEGNPGLFGPATGYTKNDYPIGPYTMTKKSASTSVKFAARRNIIPEISLSSVLSARANISTHANQPAMLESKVAEIDQFVFDRPANNFEATISTSATIEKPLGLKKHFIKK